MLKITISLEFLEAMKESKIMRIQEVPIGHNIYEYATQVYSYGSVMSTLELENHILDEFNNIIGHFGVNFEHNIIAYYLYKK